MAKELALGAGVKVRLFLRVPIGTLRAQEDIKKFMKINRIINRIECEIELSSEELCKAAEEYNLSDHKYTLRLYIESYIKDSSQAEFLMSNLDELAEELSSEMSGYKWEVAVKQVVAAFLAIYKERV